MHSRFKTIEIENEDARRSNNLYERHSKVKVVVRKRAPYTEVFYIYIIKEDLLSSSSLAEKSQKNTHLELPKIEGNRENFAANSTHQS